VRLGQGRENSKQFLRENPELADEIEQALRDDLGLPAIARPSEKAAEEAAEKKEG
jgi:recombination protein RecA